MQGYVCANSIYVYLFENIERNLHGTCESSMESITNIYNLYEFHANRIQNTLEQISFYKKKQLKLEFEIKKLK
jgi:hypothetical protein